MSKFINLPYKYKLRQSRINGLHKIFACGLQSSSPSPLSPAYQPKAVETDRLKRYQSLEPVDLEDSKLRGTFRMILPPPNITGDLHLGHALMATIQDAICRHHRQMGIAVEWVPGVDHAGIATQVVVEKMLLKERGISRHQLSRDEFVAEIQKWKEQKMSRITDDLKKLGCQLNWEKMYFTMDKQRVNAVNLAFVKLFDDGLIKRRNSLVNWSCALESVISDIEVEILQLKGATEIAVPGYTKNITFGKIYDISYRICESDEEIIVSTTRPETMLGDVAVAVHPDDERYKKYRGLNEVNLWHPFREEPIPLIFDVNVEQSYGTGAIKVTPAHDKNDFEIGLKHLISPRQVFNEKGFVLPEYNEFKNLPRFEARDRILNKLNSLTLLRKVTDHPMNLPICSRSKDVIEYMLRPQWFLATDKLAKMAISEVKSGRMQIIPSNFETEWYRWLESCQDWCISRQLWWGHQIPVYLAKDTAGNSCWIAGSTESEVRKKATDKLNCSKVILERDTDVLDTWFSSALLPFSAHNWPNPIYKESYPLDLMETGHDILFFWVARMTMLGLKLTGQAPFKKVLLNGIICDSQGRKMSKSSGNVITPQQIVNGILLKDLKANIQKSYSSGILSATELKSSLKGVENMFPQGIPECGTDALRFTLCNHNLKNHFIQFDVNECYTNRLFFNKIWQATKFTLGSAQKLKMKSLEVETMNNVPLSLWDQWIFTRLAYTLRTVRQGFIDYNLHNGTQALKIFFYSNLCDIYLETTKSNINALKSEGYVHCATLLTCLSWALQAMKPFTPFIVDELLQYLPRNVRIDFRQFKNAGIEAEIAEILGVCYTIRQLRTVNRISRKHEPRISLFPRTEEARKTLQPHLDAIKSLTQCTGITMIPSTELKKETLTGEKFDFYSTAGHLCSFGLHTNDEYRSNYRNTKTMEPYNQEKLQKLETELQKYRIRVQDDGFRRSASPAVQKQHHEKIKNLEIEIQTIKSIKG